MCTWVWPKQYAPLLGAGVQRRVHFMRNVLATAPRANAGMVAALIRTILNRLAVPRPPDGATVKASYGGVTLRLEMSFRPVCGRPAMITPAWWFPDPHDGGRKMAEESSVRVLERACEVLDCFTRRQPRLQIVQLGLHPRDDVQCIFPLPRHHDAGHRVALPVPVGDPAAKIRPQFHPPHIFYPH